MKDLVESKNQTLTEILREMVRLHGDEYDYDQWNQAINRCIAIVKKRMKEK